MNTTQGDYTLIGSDLTGLWLQPGFVEGIVADRKQFATLAEAYRHIFRSNLEYAIALWNGLPVRFDYRDDLPAIVDSLIHMLWFVQRPESGLTRCFDLDTPSLCSCWQVQAENEWVTVKGDWLRIAGNYETALNQLGMIRMRRTEFLCEWKLLLEQLIQAMANAEAVLTSDEARKQLDHLHSLAASIPSRGRFYRY